jgi:SAM-dependent methyltransferase
VAQNIYDDPGFFRAYSGLERSTRGLDGAAEWPSLRALLPDPQGLRVLDLGCGFGWFCRWAREQGAACVLGIDVSARMLARALEERRDGKIVYRRADMETLELLPAAFDLVYSSLAFHYISGLEGLLAQTHRALAPGGRLVFSVEHPIFTAPSRPGWVTDENGRRTWPVDGYLDERPRTTDWLAPGVVKQHRTLATYVNLLLRQGFSLSHVEEWGPSEAQVAARPEWADERQRPPFLLVAARR